MHMDLASEEALRSRHYLAYVGQYPGVVSMFSGGSQQSRTTVHHVVKRGVAKKGPDWWTIPVSLNRHVHGDRSIDKLGKKAFLREWDLPPYEQMVLVILYRYLDSTAYSESWGGAEPSGDEKRYAKAYYRLLKRLVQNGKQLKPWNWP